MRLGLVNGPLRASGLMIRSNSAGANPLAALCLRRVLKKSAIQMAIFSRAGDANWFVCDAWCGLGGRGSCDGYIG